EGLGAYATNKLRDWRLASSGTTRNLNFGFPLQHHRVANTARTVQFCAAAPFGELCDFDAGFDSVVDTNRGEKAKCLRDVNCARARQARADDGRDEASRVEAVGDAAAERGFGGEVLGEMDRVAVAADLGEADH